MLLLASTAIVPFVATSARQRKQQMQQEHQKSWAIGTELALYNRTQIEQREVQALVKHRFPRLGSGRAATFGGSGTRAGVAAGNSTSVNRQMSRSSAPALTGY
jgi:hypothetical protein